MAIFFSNIILRIQKLSCPEWLLIQAYHYFFFSAPSRASPRTIVHGKNQFTAAARNTSKTLFDFVVYILFYTQREFVYRSANYNNCAVFLCAIHVLLFSRMYTQSLLKTINREFKNEKNKPRGRIGTRDVRFEKRLWKRVRRMHRKYKYMSTF